MPHILGKVCILSYIHKTKFEGLKRPALGFPGSPVVKNLPCNAGDTSSIPGLGRSHMPHGNWASGPQLVSPSSGACKLQLLSPRSMTTEAYALSSLYPETREAPATEKLLNHN